MNNVKSVFLSPHQVKPGSSFRSDAYLLTSLPQRGSWVILSLSGEDISATSLKKKIPIPPLYLLTARFLQPQLKKKKSLRSFPDVSNNCNISKKSWSKYTVVLIRRAFAFQ